MIDERFFSFLGTKTLAQLAIIGESTLANEKDATTEISSISPIDEAGSGDITFLSNVKYRPLLSSSQASACILSADDAKLAPANMALIISDNPYFSYAKIAAALFQSKYSSATEAIAPSATIGKETTVEFGAIIKAGATIGDHCHIAAGSVIEAGVVIGDYSSIGSNVVISHSIIGKHVTILPGTKIGQDGFGFATSALGEHVSVPQLGRVVIEDHVHIGSNCCIDRGTTNDTLIARGARLDNLIQIGHNVEIGQGSVIVSHVGISGSTKLGRFVTLGGQVGVAGHLELGDKVQVAAQSGVMHSLTSGKAYGGSPAIPIKEWHRQTIALKNLPLKRKKHE